MLSRIVAESITTYPVSPYTLSPSLEQADIFGSFALRPLENLFAQGRIKPESCLTTHVTVDCSEVSARLCRSVSDRRVQWRVVAKPMFTLPTERVVSTGAELANVLMRLSRVCNTTPKLLAHLGYIECTEEQQRLYFFVANAGARAEASQLIVFYGERLQHMVTTKYFSPRSKHAALWYAVTSWENPLNSNHVLPLNVHPTLYAINKLKYDGSRGPRSLSPVSSIALSSSLSQLDRSISCTSTSEDGLSFERGLLCDSPLPAENLSGSAADALRIDVFSGFHSAAITHDSNFEDVHGFGARSLSPIFSLDSPRGGNDGDGNGYGAHASASALWSSRRPNE